MSTVTPRAPAVSCLPLNTGVSSVGTYVPEDVLRNEDRLFGLCPFFPEMFPVLFRAPICLSDVAHGRGLHDFIGLPPERVAENFRAEGGAQEPELREMPVVENTIAVLGPRYRGEQPYPLIEPTVFGWTPIKAAIWAVE